MGCTSSKLDDLPAVALCRDRCGFLDEAIQMRFALAEAHVAYIHSLKGVGHSLHHFIVQEHDSVGSADSASDAKLNLPAQRKGDDSSYVGYENKTPSSPKKKPGIANHSRSNSNSGSHLHFNSDSDDEDGSGSISLHHSDHSSPLHHHIDGGYGGQIEYVDSGFGNYANHDSYPAGFMHMNYMKNKLALPLCVRAKTMTPERVTWVISSS
ncbi:uncharacterized protein LOC110819098, partial [Carica papaya]|uniref:uncharacterized protein LOC110819098 n=1 Tax=Carica papaya TaxID=3649 RepID=UPI000B8CD781